MDNPTPQEAERMPPLELQTLLLRRNLEDRNTRDPYWRLVHRHFARQALRELRFLTARPTKRRNVPTAYGHGA